VPRGTAPLAKLSRPRVFGAIARERLFALLDDRLRQPALWIAGPPGAGKTTLVASYLEQRKRHALWYQVDLGDVDIATFFHYLGVAGDELGGHRAKRPLPALTPEYLPDLPGFARRFFRELFGRTPRPSLLVLDNYQEVPPEAPLHGVMAIALAELPEGVGCIVVSRFEPPPDFARLIGNQALGAIGWSELQLTETEAAAIGAARAVTSESAIKACHGRSAGWVAGLILMLGPSRDAMPAASVPAASPESTFNYFATALFNGLPAQTRELLLATACLPSFTCSLATSVSGVAHAERILRELCEHNYFVDRRFGSEAVYQVHALFREFLLERMRQEYGPVQRQRMVLRCAEALAGAGQLEEAAALYGDAGDWQKSIEIILGIAPQLLARGRWLTLRQRIAALPQQYIDAIPWLQYWRGASEASAFDMRAARATLAAAFDAFKRARDTLGQMLAAALIVESYCAAYDDMAPGARWVTILDALIEAKPVFPNVETELQVLSSLVFATMVVAPEHPTLPDYARRLMALIERDIDPNLRAPGVVGLNNYYCWIGELEEARRTTLVARALLADPLLLPIRKVWVHIGLAYFAYAHAEYDDACAQFDGAFALIAENGLAMLETFARLCETWHHLDRGECKRVAAVLHSVEPALSPHRRADIYLLNYVKGWLALLEGDLVRAKREAETTLAGGIEIAWKHVRTLNLFCLAEVLIELGEYEEAEACVHRYRTEFAPLRAPMLEFHAALIEAYGAERQRNDARCAERLRSALAIGRAHGYVNNTGWYPLMMTRLAGFALEHGIEPEYTRMLIRRRELVPDTPIESWPWPIRIHTLGRFEILKDDAPLTFEGKTQHKPIDMLKVMIALGGKDVAADKLIDILWPDPPEDGGQKVFDITVHRLRKLLGTNAVLVSDRHATLNPALVWVDAWALERTLAPLVPAVNQPPPEARAMEEAAPAVLDLYRGHFLASDPEESWQIPVRNRLSGRFSRFVLRLGEHWESTAQWSRAAEFYQRGIDLDPLAETFYRRRMVCLRAQGLRAEAIEVFRQCRQALSVMLGVTPSAETETVYRSLLGS